MDNVRPLAATLMVMQCQGANWGYCTAGSALQTTPGASASSSVLPAGTVMSRVTAEGCACQMVWSVPGFDCSNFCCNPYDHPNGTMCMVVSESCQGSSWGYCSATTELVGLKQTTSGCLCQLVWSWPGTEPCLDSCCDPFNENRPWCAVVDVGCQQTSWGYCDESADATSTSIMSSNSLVTSASSSLITTASSSLITTPSSSLMTAASSSLIATTASPLITATSSFLIAES